MRKHRIEIRSLCVLQKVNPRDFDSDDEVKARKDVWEMTVRERYVPIFYVNLCFYFNCVVDPNLQTWSFYSKKMYIFYADKVPRYYEFVWLSKKYQKEKIFKEAHISLCFDIIR